MEGNDWETGGVELSLYCSDQVEQGFEFGCATSMLNALSPVPELS